MLTTSPWHALLLAADVFNFTLSGGSKKKKAISVTYTVYTQLYLHLFSNKL